MSEVLQRDDIISKLEERGNFIFNQIFFFFTFSKSWILAVTNHVSSLDAS